MTMNQFLDRYIQGDPGFYYFQIELVWGREISGGMFYSKHDARAMLSAKLIAFLDDPEVLLFPGVRRPKPLQAGPPT